VAELKAQEVFIRRETGVFTCNNCDYKYVEADGDTAMIGGTNPPGTTFASLPANYRCPTCRSSKDNFSPVIEEIAGFAVNQGYGFGTNSMTGGQKNLLIFGGLGAFFVLFLGGYAMS
jgi:rubredoxin